MKFKCVPKHICDMDVDVVEVWVRPMSSLDRKHLLGGIYSNTCFRPRDLRRKYSSVFFQIIFQ